MAFGTQYVVQQPVNLVKVPRSWLERLFGWPWNPLRAEKEVARPNPACPPRGKVWRAGGAVVIHAEDYYALRERSRLVDHLDSEIDRLRGR